MSPSRTSCHCWLAPFQSPYWTTAAPSAVEALRYRVNGLRGLQAAFKEAADETDATVAGEQLLAQTRRLLASDIIWSDSFQEPAEVVLQEEGIEGLDVPSSEFVTTDDLVASIAEITGGGAEPDSFPEFTAGSPWPNIAAGKRAG